MVLPVRFSGRFALTVEFVPLGNRTPEEAHLKASARVKRARERRKSPEIFLIREKRARDRDRTSDFSEPKPRS